MSRTGVTRSKKEGPWTRKTGQNKSVRNRIGGARSRKRKDQE